MAPRHLMEPDPDAPDIDPALALWVIVWVVATVVMVAAGAR